MNYLFLQPKTVDSEEEYVFFKEECFTNDKVFSDDEAYT